MTEESAIELLVSFLTDRGILSERQKEWILNELRRRRT